MKYIKQLMNLIKKIFNINDAKDINIKEINEEPINEELINSLKKRDIIYVKSKNNNQHMRPLLIYEIRKNNVVGYIFNNNISLEHPEFTYNIDNSKYKLDEDMVVDISKLCYIPFKQIISYIDTLNKFDYYKLRKNYHITHGFEYSISKKNKIGLETGDIIRKSFEDSNQLYIIYKFDGKQAYCIEINEVQNYNDDEKNIIKFNGVKYKLNLTSTKYLDIKEEYSFTNRITNEEIIKLNDIFKNVLIKEKDNSITITYINMDLINSLKENDIIFVLMNMDKNQEKEIEKNHQKRPLLITSKDDNTIKGYYMTSNLKTTKYRNDDLKMILKQKNYKLYKDSLIDYNKEVTIPFENVIYLMDHLNDYDIDKFKKIKELITKGDVGINDLYPELGYVIKCDDKIYLIYQKDSQNSYGYAIKRTFKKLKNKYGEKDPYVILIGKYEYEIDYKCQKIFRNNQKYEVIFTTRKSITYDIDENKRLLKKINKCKKKNIKRPKR